MDSKTKTFKIAKCALGSILIGVFLFVTIYHGSSGAEAIWNLIGTILAGIGKLVFAHPKIYFGVPVTLVLFALCAVINGVGRDTMKIVSYMIWITVSLIILLCGVCWVIAAYPAHS